MREFYNRHRYKIMLLAAVAISAFTAYITLNTFGIRYQTNDDATLSNIAAGGYGTDTLHMVYVNVLFSALLRPLYAVCSTNWYVIVQLVLVVISIAAIIYILMKRLGLLGGGITALAMMTAFAQHIFYTFQYTECSFIILTAGMLIIINNLGSINKKTVFGIMLATTGCLIRWDVFYAVGGMSAPLLLYMFFRLDKREKKQAVITMLALFTLTFGTKAADTLAYSQSTGWKEFARYNRARTAYSDYKVYSLGEENPFEDYGITYIDYIMLNSWDFYDSEKFTTELLEQITRGKRQVSASQLVTDTYKQFKNMLHGDTYRYLLLLVILLSLVSLRPKKASIAMAGAYGIFLVLIAFLVYRMRITAWVELGMIWTVSVYAVYCISHTDIKPAVNAAAMSSVLLIILYISLPVYKQLYIDYPNYVEWSKLEQPYFEAMSRDKDNIYLLSTLSVNTAAGFDVMNPRTDNFYSNIVAYGGWLSRAPHRDEALANYGLKRPLVDAVDRENVYLDYHNILYVTEYVKQELGKEVYAVITGDNPYAPYQLVSKAPQ